MYAMLVTWEVSKLVNGWLKAAAPLNMRNMVMTWEVSHPEMSGLQLVLPLKRSAMLVTHWVFQVAMGP